MAKRIFTDYLKQNDPELFNTLIQQYGDINVLEKSLKEGKLPENSNSLTPNDIAIFNQRLANVFGGNQNVYNKYIESTKDEANLTEDELQNRLDAFQVIDKNSNEQIDEKRFKERIGQVFDSKFPTAIGNSREEAINRIFTEVFNPGTGLTTNIDKRKLRDIAELARTEVPSFYTKTNKSEDINRIQELQRQRGEVVQSGEDIENFLLESETEQSELRNEFFTGQRTRAKDYLEETNPYIQEQLAARGLGDSGQVGFTIGSKASEMFGSIQSAELQQLQEDADFFANLTYNKTLSDLISNRQELSSQIANQREKALTTQNQQFQKKQSDIESKFNLDLFNQQNERAYNQYIRNEQKKQQEKEEAENAQMWSTAAGTAAQVGTAALFAFSDIRLKNNIKKIVTKNGINLYSFDFKTKEHPELNLPKGKQIGFMAQEIKNIIPKAVSTIKGFLAVDNNQVYDYISKD